MKSYWRAQARQAIYDADATVPDGADTKTRKRIIDAAYPFGQRKYHPYKMWLKERALYLEQCEPQTASWASHETPLERMKRRGTRGK